MIKKPLLGLRVKITNPDCCDTGKKPSIGRIIQITHLDSFEVSVKGKRYSWSCCRKCVTRMSRQGIPGTEIRTREEYLLDQAINGEGL